MAFFVQAVDAFDITGRMPLSLFALVLSIVVWNVIPLRKKQAVSLTPTIEILPFQNPT
jgi:hypothetical protein